MSGASAFMTISLTALGSFGLRTRGGDTSSPVISLASSAGEGVWYGRTPVSIWYIVMPSE